MSTVLICDDRPRVRHGLHCAVSAVPGVARIDCVSSADELLTRYTAQSPDVVFVGTQRSGAEASRRLMAAHPQATVMVFGAPDDDGSIAAAIAGGARGYLHWDTSQLEPDTVPAHCPGGTASPGARISLTEREMQILRGMSQGKSNGQIGRELHLSEDTVKTYARRLFGKLSASDRAQAVAHGFRHGLVT